jgi:hypothetical protein
MTSGAILEGKVGKRSRKKLSSKGIRYSKKSPIKSKVLEGVVRTLFEMFQIIEEFLERILFKTEDP